MDEFFQRFTEVMGGIARQHDNGEDIPRGLVYAIDPWNPEKKEGFPITHFFDIFEDNATTLNDAQKVRLLRMKMKGGAQQFICEHPELRDGENQYDRLKAGLLARYNKEDPLEATRKLWTIRIKEGEDIRSFSERVTSLARQAISVPAGALTAEQKKAIIFQNATKAFVRGIPTLTALLTATNHANYEELIKRAEELHEIEQSKIKQDDWEIRGVGVTKEVKGTVRCYACNQEGHYARFCPTNKSQPNETQAPRKEPITRPTRACILCGSFDHFPINCNTRVKTPRAPMLCHYCGKTNHVEENCHYLKQIQSSNQPGNGQIFPAQNRSPNQPENSPRIASLDVEKDEAKGVLQTAPWEKLHHGRSSPGLEEEVTINEELNEQDEMELEILRQLSLGISPGRKSVYPVGAICIDDEEELSVMEEENDENTEEENDENTEEENDENTEEENDENTEEENVHSKEKSPDMENLTRNLSIKEKESDLVKELYDKEVARNQDLMSELNKWRQEAQEISSTCANQISFLEEQINGFTHNMVFLQSQMEQQTLAHNEELSDLVEKLEKYKKDVEISKKDKEFSDNRIVKVQKELDGVQEMLEATQLRNATLEEELKKVYGTIEKMPFEHQETLMKNASLELEKIKTPQNPTRGKTSEDSTHKKKEAQNTTTRIKLEDENNPKTQENDDRPKKVENKDQKFDRKLEVTTTPDECKRKKKRNDKNPKEEKKRKKRNPKRRRIDRTRNRTKKKKKGFKKRDKWKRPCLWFEGVVNNIR